MGRSSFNVLDILFFSIFGYVFADRFLTFARSHNRRFTYVPQASFENVAKAVERALDDKFITYRKKGIFPPTNVRGNRLEHRYVLEKYDVNVVLCQSHKGPCVCVGPENDRTEEQMIQLVISISNNLSKISPSGPAGQGPVAQFSELEGL